MAEMRKAILAKASTLETTMQKLYDGFSIMHKEFVHLYGFQRRRIKISQNLNYIHVFIAHVQEWTMRYEGAPLYLHKMMKPQT